MKRKFFAIHTYIAGGVSTAYRFVTPDNVELLGFRYNYEYEYMENY